MLVNLHMACIYGSGKNCDELAGFRKRFQGKELVLVLGTREELDPHRTMTLLG